MTAIALATACAVVYGAADFCGGLASKRSQVYAVVVLSQVAGLLFVAGLMPLLPGAFGWSAIGWGMLAGIGGGGGLVFFYRALATGTMSVVAPVSATVAAGLPVLFTSIAFTPAELDSTLWLVKMPALRCLRIGSDLVAVDDRLAPRPDEPVVVKKAASGFNGTDLAARIAAAGADSVLLCGATTSGCVRATAIDACALGLATFVPRECVGDRAAGPHEANLLDIDAKYADVIGLDEALAHVAAVGVERGAR